MAIRYRYRAKPKKYVAVVYTHLIDCFVLCNIFYINMCHFKQRHGIQSNTNKCAYTYILNI